MSQDTVTGSFPFLVSASDDVALRSVLDAVAASCARYLREGGYLSEEEEESILGAYRTRLGSESVANSPPSDFLAFTAEAQAKEHSVGAADEVRRMQKLLRGRITDRIHTWTFGPLPGRASSLYDHCPPLHTCCSLLVCPATLVGETVVHVASINPVAVLAAAKWVTHELTLRSGGEAPFVFPFMIDLSGWTKLVDRHFSA